MTTYGDIDLGKHWLRQRLGAWQHQAITWTSVDLSSVRSSMCYLPKANFTGNAQDTYPRYEFKNYWFKITAVISQGSMSIKNWHSLPKVFAVLLLFLSNLCIVATTSLLWIIPTIWRVTSRSTAISLVWIISFFLILRLILWILCIPFIGPLARWWVCVRFLAAIIIIRRIYC